MRRLALALVLASCLLGTASAQGATYWVQVNGIYFYTLDATNSLVKSPTLDPVVNPGDTILWEWGNSGCHDVVSGNVNTGAADGKFNNGAIVCNGSTYKYTTPPGSATYTYFCTPHRVSGMKGSIKATGTTNQPPVAKLNATPAQPKPGDTITLDASTSTDPEATLLARYRWDIDGDGVYELSTTTPSTTTTFAAGNHVVGLRVFDGKSAMGEVQQTITVAYPKPVVTTGASSNVTQTAATLAGTVDANGTPATYVFEYGPTTAYGSSTTATDAGQSFGALPAGATLSGLTPGTLYHYRVSATNSGGTTTGDDATFTTASPPPVVAPPPPVVPPTDNTSPEVTVANVATQSIATGALTLTVTPKEASTLSLKARITIPKAKAITVTGRAVQAAAGARTMLKLKLSKKVRAAIRKAIAQKKKVRAKLTLTARDAAGNVTTKSVVVRLR